MNSCYRLMGLLAETSLHAGASTSREVIDLPIQREVHNGWPCIFGSAVKGALRAHAEARWAPKQVHTTFGADQGGAAGALAVGDARLALLPVRSLTSAFRWVTCPEVLTRLKRDAKRLGCGEQFDFIVPKVGDEDALDVSGKGTLFLEEYSFNLKPLGDDSTLITALAQLLRLDNAQATLKKRLTIVSDDMFTVLSQSATAINTHIALDSKTKTVIGKALWYEETLPPETVLYVPLVGHRERRPSQNEASNPHSEEADKKVTLLPADEIMSCFMGLFAEQPWVQLGGNETVGMGWCAISFIPEEEHKG